MRPRTTHREASKREPAAPLAMAVVFAAIVATALAFSAAGRLLEARTLDWRTRRFTEPEQADKSLVIVDIDEVSLRALESAAGRWPWQREVHGLMIDALAEAGARLVVYDVLFSERDRGHEESDRRFVDSVRRAGNVVLAASGEKQAVEPSSLAGLLAVEGLRTSDVYPGLLTPLRELAEAARGVGAVNVPIDEDGVLRRAVMTVGFRGRRYASLPLVAATILSGNAPRVGDREVAVGEHSLPLDQSGRLCLRFRGSPPAYRHVPFATVLSSWGEHLQDKASSFDRSIFRDKIVIVSATASGLFDQHAGPFAGEYAGGELLATVLDDLRSASALREVGPGAVALLAGGLTVGAILPLALLPPGIGFLLGAATVALYAIVIMLAFAYAGLVLPVFAPLASGTLGLGLATGIRYATAARRQREIRDIFSRYVSESVVARLVGSPAALDLGGSEVEVSVLFSDIRGFTSHSEKMAPSDLVAQLNEYFGAMTEVILAEEGTIDKFIGDAVMAFFGAPLPQSDHPRRAVRSALRMLEAVAELNRRWLAEGRPQWAIGVGIATGPVIIGNVGSVRRLDFTVIGDTVNQASRLESENKTLGTSILVSEATARALGEDFALHARGEIRIRGKERAVTVFEVLASSPGEPTK